MKQSKTKKVTVCYADDPNVWSNWKNRAETAFLYARISKQDELEGDSNSIINQVRLLTADAENKGYTFIVIFKEDGITGTTQKRPAYRKMLSEIDKGRASAVFVKESSRLGRDYKGIGYLLEDFEAKDVRFVGVSRGEDTQKGLSIYAPFEHVLDEMEVVRTSDRCRVAINTKGNSGIPLGRPPYGYMKDPDNPEHWIRDEVAASVVRRIFSMTMDGYGTEQIAAALTADKILTPVFYWKEKGVNRPGRIKEGRQPHHWNSSTITNILAKQEYCGDVINFKTFSKSYKDRTRRENDPENIKVFTDVHDPIVDRAIWERIQEKRGKARKRVTREGEKNMFSGLLRCADCGANLHYHFNQGNHDLKYFNCPNNNTTRKTCFTTHHVRVDFLEQVVMGEIRRLTQFASRYEDDFVKAAIGQSQATVEAEREEMRKTLKALRKRDEEIDVLFSRLYEDNVTGKISDERFAKMTAGFEAEQAELAPRIKALQMELDKVLDQSAGVDLFIARVRKYTRAKKLTERMLAELIDYIEVYHAEKVDGVKTQRLRIHYACVGSIEVPDVLQLSQPQVLLQTRKGVALSYSDSQKVSNL